MLYPCRDDNRGAILQSILSAIQDRPPNSCLYSKEYLFSNDFFSIFATYPSIAVLL